MRPWRELFRRVSRKHLVGAIVALALLGISGFLSFQNARNLIGDNRRVYAIHSCISQQRELLARLNEAESALFGYVITGNSNYLAEYSKATNQVPFNLISLRTSMRGHDDVSSELKKLEELISNRLRMMQHRIDVHHASGREAAAELVRHSNASVVMDEIRGIIATLTLHETDRLRAMEQRSLASARMTLAVDIAFGSLSVLTLAAILAFLMRENVARREIETELREAGHEMEMRVVRRTADLATVNASLQREIVEHKLSEEALRASEQKLAVAARALEEKNRDLEMLIYVASHDLRSPLLNVRGFVSELLRSCSEVQALAARSDGRDVPAAALSAALEEVPEAAGFIQAAVAKMDALLNGFLRLSRLGRSAIRITRIDMNALLDNVAQSFAFQFRQSGAEIQINPLPRCSGDATQLAQVFSNLIDNALKYRDRSRPLKIAVCGEVRNGISSYRVSDNGIGIPAEHAQKVFEIFHRVSPGNGEGEGLGLTIARRILDRLDGRLALEFSTGPGSVFAVHLPAAERESAPAGKPDAITSSML